MSSQEKNYYEILEIPSDASPEEIHQGYIRSKNAYSHDSLALYSLMSKEECEKIIETINEAYSIISDPDKRQQYDKARGIKKTYIHHPFQSSPSKEDPFSIGKNEEVQKASHSQTLPSDHTRPERTLKNIVASNRFKLSFSVNENFEKEIESAVEFTGDLLQKIREYKNVDIRRMSEMIKVSKIHIVNIEEENLSKLPALVYVRGFVYQYAKCLKLNPDFVATSYIQHLKKQQENQSMASG